MAIFRYLQNGDRPPSWICYGHVWTTNEEYLVVFITVQKFARNASPRTIYYMTCLTAQRIGLTLFYCVKHGTIIRLFVFDFYHSNMSTPQAAICRAAFDGCNSTEAQEIGLGDLGSDSAHYSPR